MYINRYRIYNAFVKSDWFLDKSTAIIFNLSVLCNCKRWLSKSKFNIRLLFWTKALNYLQFISLLQLQKMSIKVWNKTGFHHTNNCEDINCLDIDIFGVYLSTRVSNKRKKLNTVSRDSNMKNAFKEFFQQNR